MTKSRKGGSPDPEKSPAERKEPKPGRGPEINSEERRRLRQVLRPHPEMNRKKNPTKTIRLGPDPGINQEKGPEITPAAGPPGRTGPGKSQ